MKRPEGAPGKVPVLTVELAGFHHRFPLATGRHHVGSLPTADIVLDAVGVSRRHALLTVTDEQIAVEDLASKNGTFVNGQRIECSVVRLGDQLAFGPVALNLEQAEYADLELGIHLKQEKQRHHAEASHRDTTTSFKFSIYETIGRWLRVVDAFVASLESERASAFGTALETLGDQLEARGACWLEQQPGQTPVVLACHGMFDAGSLERIADPSSDRQLPRVRHWQTSDQVTLIVASTDIVTTDATLHLAVWGRPPFPGCWDSLLTTLLRLSGVRERLKVDSSAQDPSEPPSEAKTSKLDFPPGYVVGKSSAMLALYRQLEAVVSSSVPVMILGDTGTGKEEIARILHRSNQNRDGSFVAINCAALPAELLEAELFGIGDRVATGVAARPGNFQLAEGGTLFLDEIGDMAPELQAKLLRALETSEIHPLGSSPTRVDVRVLAATNTQLEDKMRAGTFRPDLFYRLAGFVVTVPLLAQRRQDIPILIEHFLHRAAAETGKSIRGITVAALKELINRSWQGNVRELKHVIRSMVFLCPEHHAIDLALLAEMHELSPKPDSENLDDTDAHISPGTPTLAADSGRDTSSAQHSKSNSSLDPSTLESLRLVEIEKRIIHEALTRTSGNKSHAAQLLGISREALRRRLRR